jgi:hypothetical protein
MRLTTLLQSLSRFSRHYGILNISHPHIPAKSVTRRPLLYLFVGMILIRLHIYLLQEQYKPESASLTNCVFPNLFAIIAETLENVIINFVLYFIFSVRNMCFCVMQ